MVRPEVTSLALVQRIESCVASASIGKRNFLERTRAGLWATSSITVFWLCRLVAQWTVYRQRWWKGRPLETTVHWVFTCVWLALVLLFGACAIRQFGF